AGGGPAGRPRDPRGGAVNAPHPGAAASPGRRHGIAAQGDANPACGGPPRRRTASRLDHLRPRVRRLVQDDRGPRPRVPAGARTNREGGPAALAAAIVGATPEYGLHTDEGREPTVIVKVSLKPRGIDYSLIGLVAGERVGDGLPFFRGFRATEGDLKWLGAALASSGACSMFHLEGVTPESGRARVKGLKSIAITDEDLAAAKRAHSDGTEAEMNGLGAPQLSSDELREVGRLIDRAPPRIPIWVFTSRVVRDA